MSRNRLMFDGLAALRTALRTLPAELTDDAEEIIDDTTEVTAANLIQSYPLGETGNLRGGVKTSIERGRFGVMGTVRSTSPHAHLWEFGTANRHTRQGWFRGRMLPHVRDGLIAIASRNRRRMNGQLIDIVKRAGFEVSGDAGE